MSLRKQRKKQLLFFLHSDYKECIEHRKYMEHIMYSVLAVTIVSNIWSWNIVHYSVFLYLFFRCKKWLFYGGYYSSNTIYLFFEVRILCWTFS